MPYFRKLPPAPRDRSHERMIFTILGVCIIGILFGLAGEALLVFRILVQS